MSRKKTDIQDIKLRKQTLQQEIDLIEEKYTQKAKKISSGVQSTFKPIQKIREYPLRSVGISFAVGLLIAASGRSRRKSTSDYGQESGTNISSSRTQDDGFTSLLMNELKRMAARRAMIYISDLLDKKVMPGLTIDSKETTNNSSDE